MYSLDSLDYNPINTNKELEPINDRLIQTFYYALGGMFLGVMIAIFWSFYVSTQTNTTQIISIPPPFSTLQFLISQSNPIWVQSILEFF